MCRTSGDPLRRLGAALCLLGLAVPGSAQPPGAPEDARARAALYCHTEADDPASAEYKACTEAIAELEAMLRGKPDDRGLLSALLMAQRNRSAERSRELALALLRLDPRDPQASLYLGAESPDPQERNRYLKIAAEAAPDDPFVHGQLAEALLAAGDAPGAVEAMKRQLHVNPDATGPLFRLAGELKGQPAQRRELLAAVLAAPLQDFSRCRLFAEIADTAGELLLKDAGLRDAYIASCRGYAWFDLARQVSDPAQRLAHLRRAVQATPDHPEANAQLAIALLQASPPEVEKAVAGMEKQIEVNAAVAARWLPPFLELLRKQDRPEAEAGLLKSLLRSEISPRTKCSAVRAAGPARYEGLDGFSSLFHATCDAVSSGDDQ